MPNSRSLFSVAPIPAWRTVVTLIATAALLLALSATVATATAATGSKARAASSHKAKACTARVMKQQKTKKKKKLSARATKCKAGKAAKRKPSRRPPVSTPTTPTVPTSPTAPAPTDENVAASFQGWNGFGVKNSPPANWRPYSDSSPFNQSVESASVAPRSAEVVARTLGFGLPGNLIAGDSGTTGDYAHPVYYSQPNDPVVTLHATEAWGRAPIEGMRIAVPAAARAAGGTDGHMTIITPDGWEYDLWRAKAPTGGVLSFAWGGRVRIDGDGLNADATAARFGNLAGIIRAEELAAGKINHALFIVVKCTSNDTTFGLGVKPHRSGDSGSSFIYPASKGGSRCPDSVTDAPPMGARYRLTMTDQQIAELAVPQWKKTILTALAKYGGYVGDTGGPGFGFQFESGASYTSFGLKDPFVSYAQQNNVSTVQGKSVFPTSAGVDWARYLQVVAPPAAS